MKKFLLLTAGLLSFEFFYGQTIHLQGGMSVSKLDWVVEYNNVPTLSFFNTEVTGVNIYAGVDYLNSKYFNLSSNIGYIQKGGKEDNISFTDGSGNVLYSGSVTTRIDYISANTLAELKYPVAKTIVPFISAGPRVDYLVNYDKDFWGSAIRQTSYGLLLGGGVKYVFDRIELGIRTDFYLNFIKVLNNRPDAYTYAHVSDKTYTVNVSIGYRLK